MYTKRLKTPFPRRFSKNTISPHFTQRSSGFTTPKKQRTRKRRGSGLHLKKSFSSKSSVSARGGPIGHTHHSRLHQKKRMCMNFSRGSPFHSLPHKKRRWGIFLLTSKNRHQCHGSLREMSVPEKRLLPQRLHGASSPLVLSDKTLEICRLPSWRLQR